MNNYQFEELSKVMDIPKDYYAIQLPKRLIAHKVKETLKQKNLTYREACENIDNFSYTQLSRITCATNYNIETLLKALDALGLEIEIKQKNSE